MFRSLLVLAAGGVAVAAPVPKVDPGPAPKASAAFVLGTAVLDPTAATPRLKFTAPNPLAAAGALGLAEDDPLVRPRATERTSNITLTRVKVTTADGTELTGDDLSKRFGTPTAVVRSTVAFDPEWKKLFADDMLFLEPSGQAAVPGRNPFAPGVVNPLPAVRPGGRIVPRVPPVEPDPPPVEKK